MLTNHVLAAFLAIFAAAPAFAEILYNPALTLGPDRLAAGGSFTKSKVEMEARTSFDIERSFFAGEFHYGIDSDLRVLGQMGLSNKVEYENSDSGDGYLFGVGAAMQVHRSGPTKFVLHGVLNYISEDFSSGNVDATLVEIHSGLLAVHTMKNNFEVYGGLDLIPYSDGDIKPTGSSRVSMERDDLFNLRLGAQFLPTPQTAINISLALISETTIHAGIVFKL